MKLSLAWIFDHIDAHWRDCDIEGLVSLFNQTTAEIEHFYPLSFSVDAFYLATRKASQSAIVFIPELNKEVKLPLRPCVGEQEFEQVPDLVFLVKKTEEGFSWATLSDFGVEKEGLVPPLSCEMDDLLGTWRSKCEKSDIIVEVDNKSVTHRPDMWGHRGFAREIAAMLNVPFINKEKFLIDLPVDQFKDRADHASDNPISISNKVPSLCKKFTGLYCSSVEPRPTNLFMAMRLMKVGSRPINALVDLTNYVMLDWGQPLHAYDAKKIEGNQVVIRTALSHEVLHLLDGHEINLTEEDIVIADAKKPLCLAGVKGGLYDSVSAQTRSLFLEAATFDAGAVRRSALRHKTRTDSSARFEKTLDPNQAIEGIYRFLKLAHDNRIPLVHAPKVLSVGQDAPKTVIEIEHACLEKKIGTSLSLADVVNPLTKLGFEVKEKSGMYTITVPSYRATKDVSIKEDVVEEIARMYGFNKIPLVLPYLLRTPFDLNSLQRMRKMRHFLAYAHGMTEQQSYSFLDEYYAKKFGIDQQELPIHLVNPVSENYARLVASLMPGLFKNIHENAVHRDELRFFEIGRVWRLDQDKPAESKMLAGILFNKRNALDFYDGKDILLTLFDLLGFDKKKMRWIQQSTPSRSWYKPHQTAAIFYDEQPLGVAGNIDPQFMSRLDILPESDAFIFELDADFLVMHEGEQKRYKHRSRFQESFFDLSLFVPLTISTDVLEGDLSKASTFVTKVELLDFFEQEQWVDKRSLTFRLWISDPEKNLEKETIEIIRQQAIEAMNLSGAVLRG